MEFEEIVRALRDGKRIKAKPPCTGSIDLSGLLDFWLKSGGIPQEDIVIDGKAPKKGYTHEFWGETYDGYREHHLVISVRKFEDMDFGKCQPINVNQEINSASFGKIFLDTRGGETHD